MMNEWGALPRILTASLVPTVSPSCSLSLPRSSAPGFPMKASSSSVGAEAARAAAAPHGCGRGHQRDIIVADYDNRGQHLLPLEGKFKVRGLLSLYSAAAVASRSDHSSASWWFGTHLPDPSSA